MSDLLTMQLVFDDYLIPIQGYAGIGVTCSTIILVLHSPLFAPWAPVIGAVSGIGYIYLSVVSNREHIV